MKADWNGPDHITVWIQHFEKVAPEIKKDDGVIIEFDKWKDHVEILELMGPGFVFTIPSPFAA